MAAPLPTFQLPFLPNGPPPGYDGNECESDTTGSSESTSRKFHAGINNRDIFLGEKRCVVCGVVDSVVLNHCYIIGSTFTESVTWSDLKARGWIPPKVTTYPEHEPRNGMVMCANHRTGFNEYLFFIRYVPEVRKYVFINFSNTKDYEELHGKAVALDPRDHLAPLPALFIIHEMRVRGFRPFEPMEQYVPDNPSWQDWILSNGVLDTASDSLKRDKPPGSGNDPHITIDDSFPALATFAPATVNTGNAPATGQSKLELNADVVRDILTATRESESWKACVREGTSWKGTADENTKTYADLVGVPGASEPHDDPSGCFGPVHMFFTV
ncbi:hypothetical protein DFP72DRAFT_912492 [Ephemerocybe angulata]|uniref:HNH nuclease domain-containing protein n=1 Tax=Ephemerocybe angulata TaxID=980116 RepID=A0A8H6HME5_9AGAR|nr:hypothetical protein DFP72DRAFT_912492 [Tulosesus angulatus]